MAATKYEALVGLNYPDGKGGEVRVEAGDLVELPAKVAKAFLADGAVKEAE